MRVAARHHDGEAADVTALPYRRERRALSPAERRARRDAAIGILSLSGPEGWSSTDLAEIFGVSERTVQYARNRMQGLIGRHMRVGHD